MASARMSTNAACPKVRHLNRPQSAAPNGSRTMSAAIQGKIMTRVDRARPSTRPSIRAMRQVGALNQCIARSSPAVANNRNGPSVYRMPDSTISVGHRAANKPAGSAIAREKRAPISAMSTQVSASRPDWVMAGNNGSTLLEMAK